MTDIPDDQLVEILQVTKKIAQAAGCENFNVLQNNGRAAHQEVDHVGFFFIFSFYAGVWEDGERRGGQWLRMRDEVVIEYSEG